MTRGNTKHLSVYFLVITLIVLALFTIKGFLFLDPDFGWRLRGGNIFLHQGIPGTDVFSYTMPSFPWVDHAWSLSILISVLFNIGGFWLSGLVFGLVGLVALFVSFIRYSRELSEEGFYKKVGFIVGGRWFYPQFLEVSFKNLGYFASLPFLLTLAILFNYFGVRVQVFSWFFLATLLGILGGRFWHKVRLFVPIFFLVWANVHGSFLSGLGVLYLYIFLRTVRQKKISVSDFLILIFSALATLINPYGTGVWREVLSSIFDSKLRWQIIEWMPSITLFDPAMVFLLAFSFGLILKYRTKFYLEDLGLYLAFLAQSLLSRRHLPLWALIAGPLTGVAIYHLWQESKKYKEGETRFKLLYKWAYLISVCIFVYSVFSAINEAKFLKYSFYPVKAVEYLKSNEVRGEIFSQYGWGGYLIWQLPQKKVFIDGRMPSWRWSSNPGGELRAAFDTYLNLTSGEVKYRTVFEKFNVRTVLWTKSQKPDLFGKLYNKIEKYLKIFGWKKKDFDFIKTLEKDGWKKVFEDETSVVYQLSDQP